jgi:mono/diheme cytochrome c family protein
MKTLYIATDVSGLVGTMDGGAGTTLKNPGAILTYTYTGEGDGTVAASDSEPEAVETTDVTVVEGAPVTFTADQAASGKTAYDANCVSCHGPDLISANYGPPLAGPYFAGKWPGQSVGALYTHTHDRMPPSRPGELGDDTYADLVAYILQVNGVAAGDTALPTDIDQLNQMVIPKSE